MNGFPGRALPGYLERIDWKLEDFQWWLRFGSELNPFQPRPCLEGLDVCQGRNRIRGGGLWGEKRWESRREAISIWRWRCSTSLKKCFLGLKGSCSVYMCKTKLKVGLVKYSLSAKSCKQNQNSFFVSFFFINFFDEKNYLLTAKWERRFFKNFLWGLK